jgi:hypothetical protein
VGAAFRKYFWGAFNLLSLTGTLAAPTAPTEISDDIRGFALWQETCFGAGVAVALFIGPRPPDLPLAGC